VVLQEVLHRLEREQSDFYVAKLNLQDLEDQTAEGVYAGIIYKLAVDLERELPTPTNQQEFAEIFTQAWLSKPLLLILDEFDSLAEEAIRGVVGALRNIYMHRRHKVKSARRRNTISCMASP
jgi:Cdc6-like AAA superfamily ATPase